MYKKEYYKDWYKKNLDKRSAYCKDWYIENKETKLKKNKNWYSLNKERLKVLYKKNYVKKLLPFNERFWSRVNKTEENNCWLWKGAKYPNGYGRFSKMYAHRVSYEITNGNIPDKLFVCHSCDVPQCVNPNHLWLGTALDNAKDRDKKGRGRRKQIGIAY